LPAAEPPTTYAEGTVCAVAIEFIDRVIVRDFRDPEQFRRLVARELLPSLGLLPIAETKLPDVQRVLIENYLTS
jgi:hypothetical protein